MVIVGIDLGDVRIGIAKTDEKGSIAFPDHTYTRKAKNKDVNYIIDYCLKQNAKLIILGDPINMDDTLGFRHDKTVSFKKAIEKKMKYVYKIDIPIILWDERLSTQKANVILNAQNKKKKKKKGLFDCIAASIILESFLTERNING